MLCLCERNLSSFTMEFPKNNQFTYIIGNNGSGKSRALEAHASKEKFSRDVIVIASGASDKFVYGSKPKHEKNGSYHYLGNRTVGNGTHNGTLAANAILYYKSILDGNQSKSVFDFLETIGFEAKVGIGYRDVSRRSKFKAFETAEFTKSYSAANAGMLAMKEKPFEAVFYKDGNAFKFSELSSGEQYIINTALKIIFASKKDAIFYIDEPEVSLHVEWQIKWPERFHPLLKLHPGVKAFIATHSPVIISSALQNDGNCYLLKNNDLHPIEDGKFDMEELLFKDFNTLTPHNKHLFAEIAEIVNATVSGLNTQSRVTKEVTRAAVDRLEKKITRVSKIDNEDETIRKTFEDFKTAIDDLLSMANPRAFTKS